MPISLIDGCPPSHWDSVFSIIKEALSETEFLIELVSDSDEIGVIQKRIVQNIYDNEMVVCDVSAKNPNVMFELGMRLAFDKAAIIIKDDKTDYSFDTAPIEHLEYPRDLNYPKIQAFKTKLRDKVVATFEASQSPGYTTFLKQFGHFVIAEIDEKKVDKEGYLVEALTELRREVRTLRRGLEVNQVSRFRFSHPGERGIGLTAPDEKLFEAGLPKGMVQFARGYLETMTAGERYALLEDSDKLWAMIKAFYGSKYGDGNKGDVEDLKKCILYLAQD